jgi:hypothetical protein
VKKLIFIIIAIFSIAITNAQTVTLPTMAGAALDKTATLQVVATDYTVTNTTARTLIFTAPQPSPTTQDFAIALDSISGNHTNVAVTIYGQKFPLKGDWTAIGSAVNWKGTTEDTVIIISNATVNRYRLYKAIITGTGVGVSTITQTELKLYLE